MDNLKETMERVRDTPKDSVVDLTKIHIKLGHMIKETIKVANSAQESTGDVPTFISHKVSTLKTATILVNDLSYFLVISWKLLLMFVLINLCSVFCNIFEIICYKVVGYYVFGLL